MSEEKSWQLALNDYRKGLTYEEIAKKYGVKTNTVKSWKTRHWNYFGSDSEKVAIEKNRETNKKVNRTIEANKELTEQEKVFCLHYMQTFNATKAYQIAYDCSYKSAKSNSHRVMSREGVKAEMARLRELMNQEHFFTAVDIERDLINQANADITDFVDFGKKEMDVVYSDGSEGKELKNYVDFKDSDEVDGTLIKSIKMGKDGPSLELHDKQRAQMELLKRFGNSKGGSRKIIIVDEWAEDSE